MPRTRSLVNLRSDARKRADMENSTFCSDTEVDGYLNEGITELHDLLRAAFGDEYFEKDTTLSTVAGTATVALPADFLALTGLWWDAGASEPIRLDKYNPVDARVSFATNGWAWGYPVFYRIQSGNVRFVPTPSAVHTVRMHYIAAPTRLVADGDLLDGYSGWEDYVVWHAVMKMRDKEETDTSNAITQMQLLGKRIEAGADRDDNEPARVQRKRTGQRGPWVRR